ncbi:hypothetical protein EYR38_009817 [Pleurotus pulmonarius]|nr:hypothetical protein EYR38_009817 [Pleurotus pulmonarius]
MNNISKTLVESSKDNQDVVRIKGGHSCQIKSSPNTDCLPRCVSGSHIPEVADKVLTANNVSFGRECTAEQVFSAWNWFEQLLMEAEDIADVRLRKKSVKVSLPHGEIASILDKDSGDYEYSNDKITVKVLFQKDCVHVFPTASGMSSPSTQTEVCVSANEPRGSESGMLHAEDVSCSAGIPAVPLPVSSSSQSRRTSSGVALVMYRMRRFTAVLKKNRLVNEPESTPLIATDIPTICRLPRGPSPRNFAVIHVEAVALGGARDAVNGVNPVGGPSCSGSTPFVEQSINNGPGVFNKVAGDQYNNNNNNNLSV